MSHSTYAVVLERGPLEDCEWPSQTLARAEQRVRSLCHLHGDCNYTERDGVFYVHAAHWYNPRKQHEGTDDDQGRS